MFSLFFSVQSLSDLQVFKVYQGLLRPSRNEKRPTVRSFLINFWKKKWFNYILIYLNLTDLRIAFIFFFFPWKANAIIFCAINLIVNTKIDCTREYYFWLSWLIFLHKRFVRCVPKVRLHFWPLVVSIWSKKSTKKGSKFTVFFVVSSRRGQFLFFHRIFKNVFIP